MMRLARARVRFRASMELSSFVPVGDRAGHDRSSGRGRLQRADGREVDGGPGGDVEVVGQDVEGDQAMISATSPSA